MACFYLIQSIALGVVLISTACHAFELNGGHSRDFQVIENEYSWDKLIENWRDVKRSRRYVKESPTITEIEDFVRSFQPAFTTATKKMKSLAENYAVLTGRIKSTSSIAKKMQRNGIGLQDFVDIIGFRLTCQNVDAALKLRDMVIDSPNFRIVKQKCFGVCPGSGKYYKSGYRRVHFQVRILPENKPAEIQIGTPYMNKWADWSHDFIYKGPKNVSNSDDVKTYSLEMAEYFWKLDEERRKIPDCPTSLQNISAFQTLQESLSKDYAKKVFEKLGQPPSLCFWWNDL